MENKKKNNVVCGEASFDPAEQQQQENADAFFEARLERLKIALKVTSESDLATLLGISQPSIAKAKKRGRIPSGWVEKVCEEHGISADYILFGEIPIYRKTQKTVSLNDDTQKAAMEAIERAKGPIIVQRGGDRLFALVYNVVNGLNMPIEEGTAAAIADLIWERIKGQLGDDIEKLLWR